MINPHWTQQEIKKKMFVDLSQLHCTIFKS